MNRVFKRADRVMAEQIELCEKELQRIAVKILRKHKDLDECVTGMGSWCFWDKNEQVDKDSPKLSEFRHAAGYYHDLFKGSFGPWRVKADGQIITKW